MHLVGPALPYQQIGRGAAEARQRLGAEPGVGGEPVAASTRMRISSICRSRTWVLRACTRDACSNVSFPRPNVPAISDFVVRSLSAMSFGENT